MIALSASLIKFAICANACVLVSVTVSAIFLTFSSLARLTVYMHTALYNFQSSSSELHDFQINLLTDNPEQKWDLKIAFRIALNKAQCPAR